MVIAGLRWNLKILAFALFQVAFFGCMWLSKTVHLLYFEQSGTVFNFSASYSAMALAGYFSFFTGHLTDVWGYRRTLATGAVLYSLGLVLRTIPDSLAIAIFSGLVAGVGASAALSALRVWMTTLMTDESRAQLVGVKSATSALGTGLGCLLAGVIPSLLHVNTLSLSMMRELLALSAFGVFTLSFVMLLKHRRSLRDTPLVPRAPTPPPWQHFRQLFANHHHLAIVTTILGITTGFYVSFITPYLPLIMKDKGLNLLSIGLSTGSFALIRFLIDPWIADHVSRHKANDLKFYVVAEVAIALITGAFLLSISKWAFVLLLLMRSCGLGLSAIAEESVWLRVFPKDYIGLFFGLNQSAFFIGDFLGGLMNGALYRSFGLGLCIQIVLAVMLVNVVLFAALLKRRQRIAIC